MVKMGKTFRANVNGNCSTEQHTRKEKLKFILGYAKTQKTKKHNSGSEAPTY